MELGFAALSVFVVALMGAGHCLGMCGGIVGALSMAAASSRERWLRLFLYNIGRLSSYSLLGAVVGVFGFVFEQILGPWLRLVAGLLLILMGFYLANWWRALVWLEKGGAYLWRFLQPLGKKLLPLNAPWQALPLGMLWGFLPCGLVYTALAFAASQGDGVSGALIMLAFGLGTLPAIIVSGALAVQLQTLLANASLRVMMALMLIAFGVWTSAVAFSHASHVSSAAHSATNNAATTTLHPSHH